MTDSPAKETFEIVEPIGKRVLIRKDEDKKQTKGGIQLPDHHRTHRCGLGGGGDVHRISPASVR
jgi:hypothetical protein